MINSNSGGGSQLQCCGPASHRGGGSFFKPLAKQSLNALLLLQLTFAAAAAPLPSLSQNRVEQRSSFFCLFLLPNFLENSSNCNVGQLSNSSSIFRPFNLSHFCSCLVYYQTSCGCCCCSLQGEPRKKAKNQVSCCLDPSKFGASSSSGCFSTTTSCSTT